MQVCLNFTLYLISNQPPPALIEKKSILSKQKCLPAIKMVALNIKPKCDLYFNYNKMVEWWAVAEKPRTQNGSN